MQDMAFLKAYSYTPRREKCFIRLKICSFLSERFWMKKAFSLGAGVFLCAKTKKCFLRLKMCLFLSERFWMKKAFSLGAGVFLYAETRKMFSSPKETSESEREILDEESIFSRCRRILIRQDEKNVFFAKRNENLNLRIR